MTTKLINQTAPCDTYMAECLKTIENSICTDVDVIIAGGSVRKTIMDKPMGNSDVDIFFKTQDDMQKVLEACVKLGGKPSRATNCLVMSFEDENGSPLMDYLQSHPIQLITKEFHGSIEELASSFDFTVCQYFYSKGQFWSTVEAHEHELQMQLSLVGGRTKLPSATRMFKYLKMGYAPDIDLFDAFFVNGDGWDPFEIQVWSDLEEFYAS